MRALALAPGPSRAWPGWNIQRDLAGGTWQDAWVLVGPATLVAVADRRN